MPATAPMSAPRSATAIETRIEWMARAQHVATEMVGPQQVVGRTAREGGGREAGEQVLLGVAVGGDERRKERQSRHQDEPRSGLR